MKNLFADFFKVPSYQSRSQTTKEQEKEQKQQEETTNQDEKESGETYSGGDNDTVEPSQKVAEVVADAESTDEVATTTVSSSATATATTSATTSTSTEHSQSTVTVKEEEANENEDINSEAKLGSTTTASSSTTVVAPTFTTKVNPVLDTAVETAAPETEQGTVVWFSVIKGYGFIEPDHVVSDKTEMETTTKDNNIFVHHQGIAQDGFRKLYQGQVVQYNVQHDDQGRTRAVNVRVIHNDDTSTAVATEDDDDKSTTAT